MTKETIYKRIRKTSNKIAKKINEENLYGFALLDQLYNAIDEDFRDIKDESKQDTIILRTFDNLTRDNNVQIKI